MRLWDKTFAPGGPYIDLMETSAGYAGDVIHTHCSLPYDVLTCMHAGMVVRAVCLRDDKILVGTKNSQLYMFSGGNKKTAAVITQVCARLEKEKRQGQQEEKRKRERECVRVREMAGSHVCRATLRASCGD